MNPSNMFKQMAVPGTPTELCNKAKTKLPSSILTIPEKLHGANFDQGTESGALAGCALSVAKSEEVSPKSVVISPKPTALGVVSQYAEVEYSSGRPLTKADLMPREHIQPALCNSRNDISTLDRTLPLIQTSGGTSSRETTSYGVETTTDLSAPRTREHSSPALGGMLSWNTSNTTPNTSTSTKPQPTPPKRAAADISLSGGTLMKGALSLGSQWEGIPDIEIMAPTILHNNLSPLFSFGAYLGPGVQIPKKATRSPNRSDLHISLASAMGGSGYSFTKGSQFLGVTKVGSFKERMLEQAIPEPGSVTDNPKIESLKQISSGRQGCKEDPAVRGIAPSIQAEIISPQNPSPKRKKDTFTKEVNPVAKLFTIKSNESSKPQYISSLPDVVEETDSSRSSSDDERERVKGVPSFEDVALVGSRPWVRRITARRRMRQGEFSKW